MFRLLANLFGKPTATLTLADDLATAVRQQSTHLLACETVDAGQLLAQYPPQIAHAKKQVLFDIALARGLQGSLIVRRYSEIPLPITYEPFVPGTEIVSRKGYFLYPSDDTVNDWFMNFAHHDLFHGYGHFMFAQDEVQVAEHPALASIREMMLRRTDALRPLTVENDLPTPVLVSGAQRLLQIDTRLIYGARFARCDDATIRTCAHLVEPPTRSNILAIEAPISTGNPTYTRSEIQFALRTAYSGFRAAVLATTVDTHSRQPVVIHTGNWGCGAYGGNRQLMLSIQIMAARLAGVSKVVFYCADSTDDVSTFDTAIGKQFKFRPGVKMSKVVDHLFGAGFKWGMPDGN